MSTPLWILGLAGINTNVRRWLYGFQFLADHTYLIANHPIVWNILSFVAAVILSFYSYISELVRPTVAVVLVPTSGNSSEMELQVINKRKAREFHVDCEFIALRNSPNTLRRRVNTLKWGHSDGKYMHIRKGASENLLIAKWSSNHKTGMAAMSIVCLSDDVLKEVEWAAWKVNSKEQLPEYDLLITVRTDESVREFSKTFTLRPAKWIGPLEMVATGAAA